jgi:crotonobetainyl-CoA:carnitine CoA-transferase CaiB-like acyl-CoA transferase
MAGALAGIRVIEAASYVTGPFASQLLADMGAEIVKIEEPKRGDPFRGWGERNYAATFCSLNRNKRSVTLDLRAAEGRNIAFKLASSADVLIQNFRPGVMEKRGLGYDDLKQANPKLVYCSISGFGPKGPYRDMPGYDTVGQARSGLLSLLTDPGKPQGMGISFSDHLTGMYACYGILCALMNRVLTGKGQHVETSLLRASISFVGENAARYFETGHVPRRKHRTTTAGVFAFEDCNGLPFVLHMSSPDKFWQNMFEVWENLNGRQIHVSTTAKRGSKITICWLRALPRFSEPEGATSGCVGSPRKMFPQRRSTAWTRYFSTRKCGNTGSRLRLNIHEWEK